jgi:anti-anti-sigma factor
MVPEDVYPVQWTGRQALIALPEHIDVSNAGPLREELLSVINRGAGALIVDMTATISCDQAGARAVARAYQRAVASGTELRLAVTSEVVLQMLGVTGVGHVVPVYPSVAAASVARSPAPRAARTAAPPRRSRLTGASAGGSAQADVEVALLDRDGVVAWVNQAWQAFAAANGGDPGRTGRGVSYLQACAAAGDDPVAQAVGGAIRAALAGDLPGPLRVEVPCHSPVTERWFDVLISSRLDDHGRCLGATVALSPARSQPRPGTVSPRPGTASPRRGLMLAQDPGRKGPPEPEAVMTSDVLWSMIEAFNDGVALADREGKFVRASRRLEEMFGYQHAELAGQSVERLIPAHLQAVPAWPAGTGALLTGLHQDGTSFPVEVSLSPVKTVTGCFSLAVVRDMTEGCGIADVDAAHRTPRGQELLDSVITRLYRVGVSLQAAADLPRGPARPHIEEALRTLDVTIAQIRDGTFADQEDDGLRPSP